MNINQDLPENLTQFDWREALSKLKFVWNYVQEATKADI